MSIDDHRLIGNLCGAGLGIDYALAVMVQDMMIFPNREPDLPLDLLLQVGKHLLAVGDALVRRATRVTVKAPAPVESPGWPR
jgi:hypothetical protein